MYRHISLIVFIYGLEHSINNVMHMYNQEKFNSNAKEKSDLINKFSIHHINVNYNNCFHIITL